MTVPHWLVSPLFVILFRWSCLLGMGWLADMILRHRHARWRLILWRCILCLGLLLPVAGVLNVPAIRIHIPVHADAVAGFESPLLLGGESHPALPARAHGDFVPDRSTTSWPIPWGLVLGVGWMLGCGFAFGRLVRLSVQLSRLRKQTTAARPEIQRLALQIQLRMNVAREAQVRISDSATSPFVCGWMKPAIILPRSLAKALPEEELAALLSHEIAHLRGHDVVWCVAWQWIKALSWFHPLVWGVPAAHNLACDQEADHIAAGQLDDEEVYAQMLARLALRVLALPPVETTFALNGSSRIAQRLNMLGGDGMGRWDWKRSAAGLGLAGMLFFIAAGSGFSESPEISTSSAQPSSTPATDAAYPQNYGVYIFDGKTYTRLSKLPGGFQVNDEIKLSLPKNISVLVFDQSLADPKIDSGYLKIYDWMHLGEKPVPTVPVLNQPVEGHPGMVMLIPRQALKPGLYSVDINPPGSKDGVADVEFGVETPDEVPFWNSVLKIYPDNFQAHNHLGAALYIRGDVKGAYPHFLRATQLNPANPESHNNLALALSYFGKVDEAIKQYEIAVKLKDDPNMDTNLANSYTQAKRYDDAIRTYRHAIDLSPNNTNIAAAHCNLGYVFLMQGKLDGAISEFKRALELNPDMREAQADLKQASGQKADHK